MCLLINIDKRKSQISPRHLQAPDIQNVVAFAICSMDYYFTIQYETYNRHNYTSVKYNIIILVAGCIQWLSFRQVLTIILWT